MNLTEETAKLVDAAREARGMSKKDLADAALMPRQTLSRRLAGEDKPFTTTEIYTIAGILGVSAVSLLPEAFFQDAA
jgi:transcriptional regulator with XRE-family HTH domain